MNQNIELNNVERKAINKLAELIEKGSKGKHQITGRYEDENGGVCAFGAAFIAGNIPEQSLFDLREQLGLRDWPRVMYPSDTPYWEWIHDTETPKALDDIILSLNDAAGWDLPHIASWLRSLASQATITSAEPQNV